MAFSPPAALQSNGMVGGTTGSLIFLNPTPSISITAGGILIGIPLAGVLTFILNKIQWRQDYGD
jgi:hypothetical protein